MKQTQNTVNIRVLEASWKRFKTRSINNRRTLMEEIDTASEQKVIQDGSLIIHKCITKPGKKENGWVAYEHNVKGRYPKFGATPEKALTNYLEYVKNII